MILFRCFRIFDAARAASCFALVTDMAPRALRTLPSGCLNTVSANDPSGRTPPVNSPGGMTVTLGFSEGTVNKGDMRVLMATPLGSAPTMMCGVAMGIFPVGTVDMTIPCRAGACRRNRDCFSFIDSGYAWLF
jgi:hypothetical protein